MRVLVAMSGGVDSSVAAALLRDAGHEVVGATMKLWGGPSDSGCCSVADVEDARRVAQQLGIVHHVFNFSDDFDRMVVDEYVEAHRVGATPNPCIECNRHLKFDRFLVRARQLGFDAIATGHHARVVQTDDGRWRVRRAVDSAKDQSYVLHMLGQDQLARTLLPVGWLTKDEVRAKAAEMGLRTAAKPDSQDVCFITATGGRASFLSERVQLHRGRVVDRAGNQVGEVPAVELVTLGQRRGLGVSGGDPRFALSVDVPGRTVVVGSEEELLVRSVTVRVWAWTDDAPAFGAEVLVQTSAHSPAVPGQFAGDRVDLVEAKRAVAPGQSVVLYDGDLVLGGGVAV